MKFTKLDLLTMLIGLFLFASCKNQETIGLDIDPNSQIQGTLVNTEAVVSQTVKEADIFTTGLTGHPLGYMVDPIFGKTESSVAMTVAPNSLGYDFGTSPVLDSAVLVLNLAPQFYGDTVNSIYSVDVYQLTNQITQFKSNSIQPHNNTVLGSYTKKIFPNTPTQVFDIIAGKPDTLKKVPAQIRISLDKTFIQNTILSRSTTDFSSNAKFAEYFKGLYAEINKTNSTISTTNGGGIAFVNFAGTSSYLQLVYKKTNTTSGKDTVSVNFPININTGPVAANIKHDYSGTDIETQLNNPTPATPYNVTYVQSLVGVKTKLTFPNLANFTTDYGKAVINKAELVVDLSAGTYGAPFFAPDRLSLYRFDIAEQPQNVPDHNQPTQTNRGDFRALADPIFGGYYDSLKNRYIFVITSYVQDLIDKKLIDYGTFIAPTPLSQFQITPTASVASRAVIGTFLNSNNRVKLNIYYTKIK